MTTALSETSSDFLKDRRLLVWLVQQSTCLGDPLSSYSWDYGWAATPTLHLPGCWKSELRSSCLCKKHFTHRAISPAPVTFLYLMINYIYLLIIICAKDSSILPSLPSSFPPSPPSLPLFLSFFYSHFYSCTMWPRLALNLWSSCLSFLSARL